MYTALKWLGGHSMAAAGWCYLAITLIITFDIVARRLLGFSTEATTELTGYLMAIGMSWGLAGTLLERGHVRIDVLVQRLPLGVRVWLHLASLLALLVATSFCLWRVFTGTRFSRLWLHGFVFLGDADGHTAGTLGRRIHPVLVDSIRPGLSSHSTTAARRCSTDGRRAHGTRLHRRSCGNPGGAGKRAPW